MCEDSSQLHTKQEEIMRQFMQNALGLAVALGTGGLMFAVALI
jgi:hypothetical protein